MEYKIAVMAGDGIGPEVMESALQVFHKATQNSDHTFVLETALVGGAAIDAHGEALPADALALCEKSDAILFGSVGGPKWEHLPPTDQPERAALLPLRKHFELFANLRPAIIYPELKDASPLRTDLVENGLDILIMRELTGDVYFGEPKGRKGSGPEEEAFDMMIYKRYEIERIARIAFESARKRNNKVHSIDKANVLTTMVLWREVVTEVHKDYPDVELHHLYVDNASMQLIKWPAQFDVMLCPNLFGDILSDEASQITGSIGMLASASLGSPESKWGKQGNSFGLYEPSGGSAPDIAGQGVANPIAQILSTALMLRYSFKMEDEAQKIEAAVKAVIAEGARTFDLIQGTDKADSINTKEITDLILAKI
ncbi:MAG: 3-isopropylmalate dehydrogenase [Leptospirales bacterium]